MNPQPNSLKLIALLLSVMVMMQGCGVYYKKPVSLDNAVQAAAPVKVTTNYDVEMQFKKVILKDGKYYGVKKRNSNSENVLLIENNITEVKLYNGTMTGILYVVIVPLIILYIFYSTVDFSFSNIAAQP
jgi:hypothetical protein